MGIKRKNDGEEKVGGARKRCLGVVMDTSVLDIYWKKHYFCLDKVSNKVNRPMRDMWVSVGPHVVQFAHSFFCVISGKEGESLSRSLSRRNLFSNSA